MSSRATTVGPRATAGDPTAAGCGTSTTPAGLSDAQANATAALFKALADPNRVRIVRLLADSPEPVCVCDLTGPLGIGQPTVSHHLRTLRDAGLVRREARGTWAYYSLDGATLERLAELADLTGAVRHDGAGGDSGDGAPLVPTTAATSPGSGADRGDDPAATPTTVAQHEEA